MLACAGVALSQQTQSSTEANVSKSGDPDANTAVPRGNPEIINQKLPEDFPVLSFNAENPIDNFFEYNILLYINIFKYRTQVTKGFLLDINKFDRQGMVVFQLCFFDVCRKIFLVIVDGPFAPG